MLWRFGEVASAMSKMRWNASGDADRFTAVVGQPPIRYLASWRMQLARHKLMETRSTISQIAYEVGYESEAAFTRAFRRECGLPPAAWRKQTTH